MQGNGNATIARLDDTQDARDPSVPLTRDIEIDPPVEWNGKTYTTLHLEEPTTRQQKISEQELAGGVNMVTIRNQQIALVSQVSGVPRAVIEAMRISQMLEAYNFLAPYADAGPKTGVS
jgi:Phage tail assembly chaperone proteins, E, or 41 or 14